MSTSRMRAWRTRVVGITGSAVALALFTAARLGAQGTVVTLQGLGDLAGGSSDSSAHAISADGTTVVGESSADSGRVAFRWTAASGMSSLGVLQDGSGDSSAWAVSADGSVVVGQSASPSYPVSEAFRWTQVGGLAGLGAPGGTQGSAANAVSADGAVIVGGLAIPLGTQAFRWTAGGGFTVLHQFSGVNAVSGALALSADGGVAAGFGRTPATFPNTQAILWTAGTGAELGVLATGGSSSLNALSADATTGVGWSDSPNGTEAMRWDLNGGMTGLGDLPGDSFFSIAQGCSADGSVIVGVGSTDNGREAFLWTSTAGMVSMADFLAGNGVNLNGWILSEAVGVSADGSVIVGNGVNPNGDVEAWMVAIRAAPPTDGGGGDPGPNPNPNPGHGCRRWHHRHHAQIPNLHCGNRGPETCSASGAYAQRWKGKKWNWRPGPNWGKKRR